MTENPAVSEWSGARGEKWRAQIPGMEAMLAPVNEPLIHALRLDTPCRIADIGCGGGRTAFEILRRAPAGSVVHGFDISQTLIELARDRALPNERHLAFEVADMATAPSPEQRYDRLASRFGVMFFADPGGAFANLARWLAPGGRFAFAVWGDPAGNPWITATREAVAAVVEVPPTDPEAPGPFRYAESGKLLALLDQSGFGELDVRDWRGTLAVGGGLPAAAAADFAIASFAAFAELLAEAGDEALNHARQLLAERFFAHQRGATVRMQASVNIFTGTALPG